MLLGADLRFLERPVHPIRWLAEHSLRKFNHANVLIAHPPHSQHAHHCSQALKFKANPLKSQAQAKGLTSAQNGLEIKAISELSIAIISKNTDAINEHMYCECKCLEL
jgi:hypothetical protein